MLVLRLRNPCAAGRRRPRDSRAVPGGDGAHAWRDRDPFIHEPAAGGAPTDWHANLLADPDFTFHLKSGIRADLVARATPVTDPAERQAVLAEIVADLNQPHDPGTIRPTRLEDRANSRLVRISFQP